MRICIMRSPLSGTRRDKEVYDELDTDMASAFRLCLALREADTENWYWHELPSNLVEPTRPRFWDPAGNSDEPSADPTQAALAALLR